MAPPPPPAPCRRCRPPGRRLPTQQPGRCAQHDGTLFETAAGPAGEGRLGRRQTLFNGSRIQQTLLVFDLPELARH